MPFDLGILFAIPVALPDSEDVDNDVLLVRFRCGCEWFVRESWYHPPAGRGKSRAGNYLGEAAIANPFCPEHGIDQPTPITRREFWCVRERAEA